MIDRKGVEDPAKSAPVAWPIDTHRQSTRAKSRTLRAFPSTHAAGVRDRNEVPALGCARGGIGEKVLPLQILINNAGIMALHARGLGDAVRDELPRPFRLDDGLHAAFGGRTI
jgi:hypothetical protein